MERVAAYAPLIESPLGIKVTLVEPGNFRTEFAGDANIRPVASLPAYRGAIAPIEDFLYGQAGRQPGEPAKAAEAMIAVVDDPAPPRRLVGRPPTRRWTGRCKPAWLITDAIAISGWRPATKG